MNHTSYNHTSYQLSDIFTCTRCGYCCQGDTTVSLDTDDQQRMISKLGLTRQQVEEEYWQINGPVVQMKTVDNHCIFYQQGTGCSVHEARPWRCGQWPLHPSMLDEETNFYTIRESCPGLNQELNWEEFSRIFKQLLEQEEQQQKKLLC
ncbi:YkgJ family cysteine cluster protein [Candidatus Electrothrix sp.]|uniref:YkgJ family cysteine cluster protein n=1 Tax=Candidatus Electrothrix sp. TaxID=2170559 RepID=UPI0040569ACD